MSFDLAVLSGARPLEPDEAADMYRRLARGQDWVGLIQADPNVAEFVRDITRRWPQIDSVPADELDGCPWSQAFDLSPAHVIATIVWSRANDVGPVYVETALKHGLNVFDPQVGLLHSPGKVPRPITRRNSASRVCATCGKPIDPSDLSAEEPGRDGVFHLACMLGQSPQPLQ